MTTFDDPNKRKRLLAAIGTVGLQGLLGYALLVGLATRLPVAENPPPRVFELVDVPPPVETLVPPPLKSRKPAGRAAPPNRKAVPAAIVAPPIVLPEVPPPLLAALLPGLGADPEAGAAVEPGPGTGSGGTGDGTGSGGAGDGAGDGDGTPSRRIGGRITDADYPRAAGRDGISGMVSLEYTIGIDGRVSDCAVVRSSGSALLDETTCRLVRQRYRYKPARDGQGRKVPDYRGGDHHWIVTESAPPPEVDGR